MSELLVVVDTSVVIAHLTAAADDTDYGKVVRACGTGTLQPALSDASLKELTEVVKRLDRQGQIVSASRAFEAAMDLWNHGKFYRPRRFDWPTVVDPDDHWVLDLAWDAQADFIVSLDQHLIEPTMPFPVQVVEPHQMIAGLRI